MLYKRCHPLFVKPLEGQEKFSSLLIEVRMAVTRPWESFCSL